MSFPDFIPIKYEGMSIISALIFLFYGISAKYVHSGIKDEFDNVHKGLQEHESDTIELKDTLNAMKTDIALLLQSMQRVEKTLDKK